MHGILDGPFQEQSKHPQEPKLPPNLQKSVTTALLSCHILPYLSLPCLGFPCPFNPKQSKAKDPATPGSPCSKPRCWLVIDWTLINYKSIVTGSPLLLLRLKKTDITHRSVPSALPSAHPIDRLQLPSASSFLGKGSNADSPSLSTDFPSQTQPASQRFTTPKHQYFCSQPLSFFQL